MGRFVMMIVLAAALASGCAAGRGDAPALRPVQAWESLLQEPDIAAWHREHSAPAVTVGMTPGQRSQWRRYRPAVMVDLVSEGMRVTLESRFGAEPRRLEFLLDRQSGAILKRN